VSNPNLVLPLRRQHWLLRSAISLLPTAAALLGRDYLPAIVNQTPAALHYPVVFFATWVGGFLPGLISTTLCTLYSVVILRPQLLTAPLSDLPSFIRTTMFFTTCLLFLGLIAGLQRALERASRAIRVRDEFMTIASHELKTPISTLMLRTQVRQLAMKRQHPSAVSSEQISSDLEHDLRNLQRINALVSDMLDISRIQKGTLPLVKERFDLRDLIGEVTKRISVLSAFEQTQVDLRLGEDPVIGNWDKFRLEQVYMNLLTNAFRYGRKAPILVTVKALSDEAILTVQDHGIGIAKKDLQRIFKKFERAIHSNEVSGLGLGLYISDKIVTAHNGRISVESEPDLGTIFTVRLPLNA
jgi:signal transduction histidine kinase